MPRFIHSAFSIFILAGLLGPVVASADKGGLKDTVQQIVDGLCGGDASTCSTVEGPPGPRGPRGLPGEDGEDGAAGPAGEDGSSCTVTQDEAGATISCDDGSSATVLDGEPESLYILNDILVAHQCPAAMSRYRISVDGQCEEQYGSGVWISTAAGSTAGILSAGGRVMRPGSKRIQYMSRELFDRPDTAYSLRGGTIDPPLV